MAPREKIKRSDSNTGGNQIEFCDKVREALLGPLRGSELRKALGVETPDQHATMETLLNSSELQSDFARARNAFFLEHIPGLLELLVKACRAKEQWAWKALLESLGLKDALRPSSEERVASAPDEILSTEFERSLLENVRDLVRGGEHDQRPNPLDVPNGREE